MSNVYISTIQPPRIARNKRIYAGNVSIVNPRSTGVINEIHIESGMITDLLIPNVVVYFAKEFDKIPVGWIKVYRMREIVTGRFKQQDVLYYHAASDFKNTLGFGLVIDSKESLTGVIVEYFFI